MVPQYPRWISNCSRLSALWRFISSRDRRCRTGPFGREHSGDIRLAIGEREVCTSASTCHVPSKGSTVSPSTQSPASSTDVSAGQMLSGPALSVSTIRRDLSPVVFRSTPVSSERLALPMPGRAAGTTLRERITTRPPSNSPPAAAALSRQGSICSFATSQKIVHFEGQRGYGRHLGFRVEHAPRSIRHLERPGVGLVVIQEV